MGMLRMLVFCSTACIIFSTDAHRNIHRPEEPSLPEITTYWTDTPQGPHYKLKSGYLEEWAIFGRYNADALAQYQLPATVSYHYEPTKSVSRTVLEQDIQYFINELNGFSRKPKEYDFRDFEILKDSNFNYKIHAGIIIIKHKKYPFVVKLFVENPESFTQPFNKGPEPSLFFMMGGGINRFLAGFTRIPNLKALQQKINASPDWSHRITLPRKWYWTPKDVRTFTVVGKNIGPHARQQELPSTYAIICDEIRMERQLHTYHKSDRLLLRDISQFLGNSIDPHIYNFFIEKETGNLAIIDTEHFASVVGLKEPIEYKSKLKWYTRIANKYVKDSMFRTKKTRQDLQKQTPPDTLIINSHS